MKYTPEQEASKVCCNQPDQLIIKFNLTNFFLKGVPEANFCSQKNLSLKAFPCVAMHKIMQVCHFINLNL